MTRTPGRSAARAALGALLVASALLQACTPPGPPVQAPGDPAGATGPTGPAGAVPGGASGPTGPGASAPTGPLPLPGLVGVASVPGSGSAVALDPSGGQVDPASTFEVRLPVAVTGARLVLLDAQDALVPSSSEAEPGPPARFTLTPAEPLRPGSRFQLRLEGTESRLVRAPDGRTFEPASFPLTTTGEPPPRAPPRKGAKKRAR